MNTVDVLSKWLEELCKQKNLWNASNPDSNRIPWYMETEALDDSKWNEILNSRGIYLFGTKEGIIRYVGKTEDQTLHERLRGRYVGGEQSQCKIAKSLKVSKVRLRGALDFTYHGIDDMWFTVLAVEDKNLIASLESMFILTAKKHRMNKNVKGLLNDKN